MVPLTLWKGSHITTNTTNSQAASIADDQNTREETFVIPLPIFNGVLLQALKEGCTELRRQDNEQACRVTHALMAERDEWKDRAIAAEARLAEIQRGVEGLKAWLVNSGYQGVDIEAVSRDEVLAMFAPQGQSDECRMEDPQWTAEQIEKLKAAGSQPFEFNRIEISDDTSDLPG